jgi:hypothetical protein
VAAIRLRSVQGLNPNLKRQIRQALLDRPQTDAGENIDITKPPPSNSKWHNVRTTLDGITFASKRESRRYAELKIELRAGEIADLELQKTFSLDVNGVHICDYIADFVYRRNGVQITEDAKGKATELYRIKKALMRAIYGIEIIES